MRNTRGIKRNTSLLLAALVLLLCGCGGETAIPPDDPLYSSQTNLAAIHVEAAWQAGLTGKGVKIAVIDTGVAEHPDLDTKRITGKSYVGSDETDLTDKVGHGTFIAGLLCATRNNGVGIAGMTESDLVVLKVWDDGSQASLNHLSQAIRDAVDVYGCDVLNISMGTTNDDAKLREAVEYAVNQGAILVAAAPDAETVSYPAGYPHVIAVSAAGNDGSAVSAPGEKLAGLHITGGYVRDGEGASYAAAHVTALAAFARQKDPSMTAEAFGQLMAECVTDGMADAALLTEKLKG